MYGEKYLVGNTSHICLFGFVIVASPAALKMYVKAGGKQRRATLFECPGGETALISPPSFSIFSLREKVVFSVVFTEVNVGQKNLQ